MTSGQDGVFEGRPFRSEVILWTLRWYLAVPISYGDLSAMPSDRGVAVDGLGQTIGFLWSAQRDAVAAKRFFRKALARLHTVNPRTITVDKNPAYPRAAADMRLSG